MPFNSQDPEKGHFGKDVHQPLEEVLSDHTIEINTSHKSTFPEGRFKAWSCAFGVAGVLLCTLG